MVKFFIVNHVGTNLLVTSRFVQTTMPTERLALRDRGSGGNKENRWNNSDQALRFQHEQEQRRAGQRKKRIAEVGHSCSSVQDSARSE